MWRRSILTVGFLGAALLVYVAIAGLGLDGVGDELLPRHVLSGFGAFVFLAFVDLWLLLFLRASTWAARATVRERKVPSDVPSHLVAANRLAWPWTLAALVATAGAVVTGGLAFTATVPQSVHGTVVVLAVLLQAWAFWRANRTLRAHDRYFAELAAEAAA